MKWKTTLYSIFVFTLLIYSGGLFSGTNWIVNGQGINSTRSFPILYPINILSPSNSTYACNVLILNVTNMVVFAPSSMNITMSYLIDGEKVGTIPVAQLLMPQLLNVTYANGTTTTIQGQPPFSPDTVGGSVVLPRLQEGPHNVTVLAHLEYNNGFQEFVGENNSTSFFTINDEKAPLISIISILNQTYVQNNLPLNFSIDEPTSWIGYSLDGGLNVTIDENLTIKHLPNGSHVINVYANDTAGNMGKSNTVQFVIEAPSPNPTFAFSPSPTVPEFNSTAVAILALALCLFLAVELKKKQ